MTAGEGGRAGPARPAAAARRKGERAPAVTRAALLEAGIQEFAASGFGGARTDLSPRPLDFSPRCMPGRRTIDFSP